MSKNIKEMLAKKLLENSMRHAQANQEPDLDLGRQHTKINIDLIDPNPYQPRTAFPQKEIDSLAVSIQVSGLLQPISVREFDGRYQLIAGERRLRACKVLKKISIEALVIPSNDAEMATLALAENIERSDLSDYEIGKALRQIEKLFPNKTRLAEAVGINREDMYKYFSFEALPLFVLQRLDVNPKLLARSAATEVKRVLKNVSPALISTVMETGWQKLENGEIEQSKLAAWLTANIKAELAGVTATHVSLLKTDIVSAGKKVGSLVVDHKNLVLKLSAIELNQSQITKLQDFVQTLLEVEQVLH